MGLCHSNKGLASTYDVCNITLVMIYNARGEMSLVWALGKNTSPGREVGVNPNLLYFVIIYAFAYSSDAGTPKTIIVA